MSTKLNLAWFIAAGIRSIRTFAQTAAAMLTIGGAFEDIDWIRILSVSATALIYSIITSLTGLPEAGKAVADGVLKVNSDDPTKDVYKLELNKDIETLPKKKVVVFKVEKPK